MDETNPYLAPSAAAETVPGKDLPLSGVLLEAGAIVSSHFFLIISVVGVIWIPLELVSSYMTYFVFEADDLRNSFKLAQFLENFIGIIATAAVISIGAAATRGEPHGFVDAMSEGLGAWPRMFWTRFLSVLLIIVALLLFIVPGVYVAVRLSLAECVAVVEHTSGPDAMSRSLELTRQRFWYFFGLCALMVFMIVLTVGLLMIPTLLLPDLDHWVTDALSSFVCDLIAAYGTLCFFCAYRDRVERKPPLRIPE